MLRTIMHKQFNGGEIPVDVVVETYDSGVVVEYPSPSPRLIVVVDSPVILADGQSSAAIAVREETWSLVNREGVWTPVPATDDRGRTGSRRRRPGVTRTEPSGRTTARACPVLSTSPDRAGWRC